jgi:glycine/D-amino acid oxidase-like deaminating enzyme
LPVPESPVVVVGAGIVGASVTYHLARLGVPVTVIDRWPAPAAGVTATSFAWIGDSGGGGDGWPGGAEDLRGFALGDHRRLVAEVPGAAVRWTGALSCVDGATPGEGQEWIGRDEIAAREPHLAIVPERAVLSRTDGGVDPVGLTRALVEAARAHGAQIVTGAGEVTLDVSGGKVRGVLSARGRHPASTVVLAAGTGTAALSRPLGVSLPVAESPALLLRLAGPVGLIRTIVVTPDFEARELRPGHLLATAPLRDGRPAERAVEIMRSTFHGGSALRLLDGQIGTRPMPAGGPLLGWLTPDRSVYVAVMHSAVTLAPTAGRLVAQELVSGEAPAELERCRPARQIRR